MKRLSRWLFNLAAAVSLGVALVTATFWIRSYWVADSLSLFWGGKNDVPPYSKNIIGPTLDLRHWEGRAMWIYGPINVLPAKSGWRHETHRGRELLVLRMGTDGFADYQKRSSGLLGFRWYRYLAVSQQGIAFWYIELPDYFLALAASFLPLAWIGKYIRAHMRPAKGKCAACGYDLRATPERCPECGAAPSEFVEGPKRAITTD